VLGTQETFCIVIAGLLERDSFDLLLLEFDKPWVIHLRETCCCSMNLCTWRPNTVYRNRSVRRHHASLSLKQQKRTITQIMGKSTRKSTNSRATVRRRRRKFTSPPGIGESSCEPLITARKYPKIQEEKF
jgi:hypothetical protein